MFSSGLAMPAATFIPSGESIGRPKNVPGSPGVAMTAPVRSTTRISDCGSGGMRGVRGASASRQRSATRNGLVVVQVALALVLVVSAVLMVRTFQALRDVRPGFVEA